MDDCVNGTTTLQGWTQPKLKALLDYCGAAGASTVTLWSNLIVQPQYITDNITDNVTHKTHKNWPYGHLAPWSTVLPSKLHTCPWFVPTLLDWVNHHSV